MFRFKSLFMIVLTLLLVFFFSACTDQQLAQPTSIPPSATLVPPTNTPAPTDTPTPTATPTPTETPTPTPEIPPEMSAEMDEIEAQISNMRGLTLSEDFEAEVYDQSELEQYYTGLLEQEYPEQEEFQDLVSLSYLGLIPPDFSLYDFLIELYSEQTFGFYDVNSNRMVLLQGAEMDGLGRLSYAMHITQAMLDQSVELDGAFGYNDQNCDQHNDQCAALQALITGDSALTGALWMLANLSPAEQAEIATRSQEAAQDSVLLSAPLFFQENNSFPATVGSEFVGYLYQQGGWAAVDQSYQNPPQSSEHIMHPDRYPADLPMQVTLPDLLPVLGEGWELLDQDTLGEWGLLLMLSSGVDPAARQEIQSALSAVNGWGGDLYSTYFNPDTGQIVLVSKVQWDTAAEASEFINMLGTHVNARFASSNTDDDLSEMFAYLQLGYAQWQWEEDTTYYVLSPSVEISEAVLAAVVGE
jgi:hypothetical protein